MIHEAIIFAALAHEGQKRKGTDVPYIVHPFEVAQMVADLTRHDAQFGQYGLLLRLVQVLPQSLA